MTGLRFSMIGKGFLSAFAFLLSSAMVLWAAPANAADPAVYGALPDVAEVEISPDGKTIAALRNVNGEASVYFYDLANPGSIPTGMTIGSNKARGIQWVNNEYLLLLASISGRIETSSQRMAMEFWRWLSVSKSTQETKILFRNEGGYYIGSPGVLASTLPDSPETALFARIAAKRIGVPFSLHEANLKTGRVKASRYGEPETTRWVMGPGGEVIARVDYDAEDEERRYYLKREDNFKLVTTIEEPLEDDPKFSLHASLPDSRKTAATGFMDKDTRMMMEYDIETNTFGDVLFSNPEYDLGRAIYNPMKGVVTGVYFEDDLPNIFHLDPDIQKLQDAFAQSMPGARPLITSMSDNGSKMIVTVYYHDHPSQFFVYDKQARQLDFLLPSYNALDGTVAAQKEKFDYVSSDELTIPGYLTLPAQSSRKDMPLIVLPHGGPHARDNQSFDWWAFFYAARGYAVYQPNFRGSTGYGGGFRNAGYQQWGRKMQDDITEGVEKLIADGIADPERICIVGASYGGYAALAGATLTPELYACAVSVNGVSSIPTQIAYQTDQGNINEGAWDVRIGRRNSDFLRTVSPNNLADKVQAPILLIHGKDDTVVPVGQSKLMRNALKEARKRHEYVELPGEDHWLSTSAMRTEMLRRSIEFIDAHIGE